MALRALGTRTAGEGQDGFGEGPDVLGKVGTVLGKVSNTQRPRVIEKQNCGGRADGTGQRADGTELETEDDGMVTGY